MSHVDLRNEHSSGRFNNVLNKFLCSECEEIYPCRTILLLNDIDQLRAERDEARDYMVKGAGIVLALESRLSLAIEGLREIMVHSASAVMVAEIARRTLARIEEGS